MDMKLDTATARSACAFSSAALFSEVTLQHQPIKNHEQDINSRNERTYLTYTHDKKTKVNVSIINITNIFRDGCNNSQYSMKPRIVTSTLQ